MSNILTSDWETTFYNRGNPFDERNFAVALACKQGPNAPHCEFSLEEQYDTAFLLDYDLCIFFNAKFDLHWYRKLGYTLPQRVWCCQVAEFILGGQQQRYPSLEDTSVKYGLGHKIDVIEKEYWSKGINTDAIPKDILSEYACQDVDLTYQVYLKQKEQFDNNPQLYRLFRLVMLDLLVLEEMEWNGLIYDEALCKHKSEDIDNQIQTIKKQLSSLCSYPALNFNSGDQLSAFLYGGSVVEEYKEHIGFYKTGLKAGQPKFQNKERVHILPQLVKPLAKSELKKEGFYATDEATLRKLKGGKKVKEIIELLLELSKLEKLNGTYYNGLPNVNKEMHWPAGKLHGQFNQCVAATGRLSSSKPNLQNFAGDCEDILISRYD
jgi:DNA polymerase-1